MLEVGCGNCGDVIVQRDDHAERAAKAAVIIQRAFRQYKKMVNGFRQLQVLACNWLACRKTAAILIQSVVRMWIEKRHLHCMHHSYRLSFFCWLSHSVLTNLLEIVFFKLN